MNADLKTTIALLHSWHANVPVDSKYSGVEHPWFELSTPELVKVEREAVELVCTELLKRLEKERK